MAMNPCVYCGAEVPEGYGHVCPNCAVKMRNVAPQKEVGPCRNRRFRPIYKPSGRAREYGEYAINIYTGCNHGCTYCYAPKVLHMDRAAFDVVRQRDSIVKAVWEQLSAFPEKGKTIALCFTCDPYPRDIDTTPTREIIRAIKTSGNHVQILTKNPTTRDFDLLDGNDWFGVTLTCNDRAAAHIEPGALLPSKREAALYAAREAGIRTWISLEPVLDPKFCYGVIRFIDADLYRIGKLNYYKSHTDWAQFGRKIEELCVQYERRYYIKEDLRLEMRD